MATMPQIGIVDASTGSMVAMGVDSADAYYKLIGISTSTEETTRFNRILKAFIDAVGQDKLMNVTWIQADVGVQEQNITYLDETEWNKTAGAINSFLDSHVGDYDEVFMWASGKDVVNFGILALKEIGQGYLKYLYYISVRYG